MPIKYVTKLKGKYHSGDLDVNYRITLNEDTGCDQESRQGFCKMVNITYV